MRIKKSIFLIGLLGVLRFFPFLSIYANFCPQSFFWLSHLPGFEACFLINPNTFLYHIVHSTSQPILLVIVIFQQVHLFI